MYIYIYMLYTHIYIYIEYMYIYIVHVYIYTHIYIYIYMCVCVCRGMACLITGTIYLMVFQESISAPQPQFSQFRSDLLVLDLPTALSPMASPSVWGSGHWHSAPCPGPSSSPWPKRWCCQDRWPCLQWRPSPARIKPEQRRGPVVAKRG